MADDSEMGTAEELLAREESGIPLAQFCAQLSEAVSREQLSTWSMIRTVKRRYPELPETDVAKAVLSAIEDRRKEQAWKP